jgi:hypothetical protein
MEQLAELARTGGPGWVVAFLAFTAVVYLFRQLSKEREMCANDWRTTVAGNSLHEGMVLSALTASWQSIDGKHKALEHIAASEIGLKAQWINCEKSSSREPKRLYRAIGM